MKPAVRFVSVCLASALLSTAWAGESRAPAGGAASGGSNNNMMFQRMLQQTTEERDQLAVEVGELKKKLADEEKARTSVEKKLAAKESSLDKFKDANSSMTDMLETMKTRMEDLIEKYREVAQQLRDTEQGKLKAEAELAQLDAALKHQIENNAKLVAVNMEVLAQYEDKGVWDALFQQEPVTQLKSAEIEAIREQYRVEIERLKAAPDAGQLAGR